MLRIIDKTTKLFLRDDTSFDSETEIALDVKPASGLYSPMWDEDTETWVEGLNDDELTTLKAEQAEKAERAEKIAYLEATNYISWNYSDCNTDEEKASFLSEVSDTFGITNGEIITKRKEYKASL